MIDAPLKLWQIGIHSSVRYLRKPIYIVFSFINATFNTWNRTILVCYLATERQIRIIVVENYAKHDAVNCAYSDLGSIAVLFWEIYQLLLLILFQ
jgi:hypothetical protein